MGWLDTPEQRRKQHLQMIATGNIRDIDRIQERERRRRITGVFWFLFILSLILGFSAYKVGFVKYSFYLFGFALLFLIVLLVRYGFHKKVKLGAGRRSRDDWERIRDVPGWVYRKMRRRHKHKVNGKHFVYKREGNQFYRRRR